MAKMMNKLPSLEQAKIRLHFSQAALQAQIALQEQERSTASVTTLCSSFNSAYAVHQSNFAMGREYTGSKGNTPQDLDI